MPTSNVLLIFLLYCLFSTAILLYINNAQPNPYMDEIFHVPQAQKYCKGNFSSWDPMITTLPGLYLTSVGLLHPVSVLLHEDICTTFWLRCVSLLFMCGNFYLIYAIYIKLHPKEEENDLYAAITAFTLSLFPVLYFFTFMYYTDPGSTFFVLLMYLFYLHGNKFMAAVFGVVAIFFRQTNIIWVIFLTGLAKGEVLMKWLQLEKKEISVENSNDLLILQTLFRICFQNLGQKPKMFLKLTSEILLSIFWFILVGLGFIAFIYINNGIVVGDKSHHEACLNFPQIFYFLSLTLFFSSMYMISLSSCINFLKFSVKKFWVSAIFLLISWILIYKFTYVHEYLLADNRHYTFYVWSKIYRRHNFVKYALIPVYYYAAWSFVHCLKHNDILWKLSFGICLLACSIPQKLMEFRYFIIPYLLFRLNMKSQSMGKLMSEMFLYVMINTFTVYVFVNRPFKWDNSAEYQRFMW